MCMCVCVDMCVVPPSTCMPVCMYGYVWVFVSEKNNYQTARMCIPLILILSCERSLN